jgi:hypothetical protein
MGVDPVFLHQRNILLPLVIEVCRSLGGSAILTVRWVCGESIPNG